MVWSMANGVGKAAKRVRGVHWAMAIAVGLVNAIASSQADDAELVAKVQAARDTLTPVPTDRVATRRGELSRAMADLDRSLGRTRPGYAEGWKTYLHWNELAANASNEAAPDTAELRLIWNRFREDASGLEMPKFLNVRDRLRDYIDALETTRDDKLQEKYTATVDELAKRIEEYVKSPSGANGPEIGRAVGWLQASGQGDEIVTRVNKRFDYPNLVAHASNRFLAMGFNGSIDRTTGITDEILGTSLRGTARFVGSQQLDPIPSGDDARLNISLRGNIFSNNVGVNGPATIHTTATTSISATKQIVINQNGVFALPARTGARTNSNINSISANCGLVERIAWKRAGEQKSEAEAIGSSHAAGRMNALVNQEAIGPVSSANYEFQRKFRAPLLRRGHLPRMHVNTDVSLIGLQILQMTRGQIAAPNVAPVAPGYPDLAVQAHESFVANFSEAAIGGIELTDERLAKMLLEQTGKVPEELQITDDKEPWSITFTDHRPVVATFNNNQVAIAIRANRFTRGRNADGTVDQEIKELVEISATYNVEKTDSGVRLVRQGEVTVDFVGQPRLSAAQVGTKTFLRRKFGSLFKPEIVGEGMQLKGRWARAGKLVVSEAKVDQGWVSLAWVQSN